MIEISTMLLDDTSCGDKIYVYDDIALVDLMRQSNKIKEFPFPAVYMLLGEECRHRQIYIGQTSDMYRRLKEHKIKKDFWIECLFFLNKEKRFTKTELLWLEENLIKDMMESHYYDVMQNFQIPEKVDINTQDIERMDLLMDKIRLLAWSYGGLPIEIDKEIKREQKDDANRIINRIAQSYYNNIDDGYNEIDMDDGIKYRGGIKYLELGNGNILVFKDSEIRGTIPPQYQEKVKDGILTEDIVVSGQGVLRELMG